ncbi:hypothetical protein IC617_05860 [Neiella sp. HB171785]|uniref:Uncharacterized protein n=1 Tax=Neiella litorisoli TaxID=2771431 RepID=A0A8J6QUF9_9GAMM|nr:hypothetical protein [Neiella litorisoli]MBD1388948.1 hypothetical protein [Neiella litorisoli]
MTFDNKLISQQSLAEHFSTRLQEEAQQLPATLSASVLHYLAGLLGNFHQSDRLFEYDDSGALALPTLALLYQQALAATTVRHRHATLRELGDKALFLGAMFPEHYVKKGIKRDYFIGMGSGAYDALGSSQHHRSALFGEMAERFPQLLQLVATVCCRWSNYDAEEIFGLIERWQQGHDETQRKQLAAMGIVVSAKHDIH